MAKSSRNELLGAFAKVVEVEKTSFIWCNENVLCLSAPLDLVSKFRRIVSQQLVGRVGLDYAIYY